MSQSESLERVLALRRSLARLKLPTQAPPWERPENASRKRP